MSEIHVLIVEDDPLIASDIEENLTNVDYRVIGLAYNKIDAFELLTHAAADIAILDINLGDNMDGFEIAKKINEKYHIPFVFLTSYASKEVVAEAKKLRPMGYLVKPFDESDLFTSIEIALHNYGQIVKPKTLSMERINDRMHTDITTKEFEVIQDIYDGLTNMQMADKHFVSINTIKTHVKKIYDKLDTHSRSETIAAIRKFMD